MSIKHKLIWYYAACEHNITLNNKGHTSFHKTGIQDMLIRKDPPLVDICILVVIQFKDNKQFVEFRSFFSLSHSVNQRSLKGEAGLPRGAPTSIRGGSVKGSEKMLD